MKTYLSTFAVLVACAVTAGAQTAISSSTPTTGQGNAANPPGTTLPPGLEKRDQLPPSLQYNGNGQLPPGLAGRTNDSVANFAATNRFGATNLPFGSATNQFGVGIATNRFAATNDAGVGITPLQGTTGTTTNQFGSTINRPRLAPTGPLGTNLIYSTNSGTGTMRTNSLTPPR